MAFAVYPAAVDCYERHDLQVYWTEDELISELEKGY
jgi:hypothetical protein